MKIDKTEIFIIPVGDRYNKRVEEVNIIYSPLCNICCTMIDNATTQHVVDVITYNVAARNEKISEWVTKLLDYQIPDRKKMLRQSPEEYTTLSLLPNHACNFQCRYCYSAQGRSQTMIDRKKLQQALDFFINPVRLEPQKIKLFISGGGEPLLKWEDTLFAIVYAHERALQYGFTLWTTIITNGSIINEKIVDVLKKYKCGICVSFEVFEEFQNNLRGHYTKVSKVLTEYGQSGIPVSLNSTITAISVSMMKDMVGKLCSDYSFVTDYTLEPVTDHTLFDSPAAMKIFYQQFSKNYFDLKKEYSQTKIKLWCTLDVMMVTKKLRYCPGKLCLTPHATFSICHCVSSEQEERYEKCVYGKITDDGVVFDMEKFKQLININVLHREKCRDCFAKWNCGGECMTRQDQYPEEYMEEVCNFNRQWLITQLEERYGCFNEK